ncbi:CCE_0567 family metalloprotein, partial [Mesorhizobium sp. PL10]
MSDLEKLQKKVRKLQSRAGTAKMDLHDLAEGLPVGWRKIKTVAEKTFDVFFELDGKERTRSLGEHDDQPVRYPRRLQMDARLSD